MKMRRRYPAFLLINGVLINEIVIDPHYERKHSDHMNDELIIQIVKMNIQSLKKGQEQVKHKMLRSEAQMASGP